MVKISSRILAVPKLFVALGFFLLPFTFLRIYMNLSFSDALFAVGLVLALLALIPFRADYRNILFSENVFFVPVLILTAGFLLSLPCSMNPQESLTAYAQVFFIFCVVHPLMRLIVVDAKFVSRLLKCFLFSAGVISTSLIVFTLYGLDVSYGMFLLQEGWRGRYSYGGYEPNIPARIALQMAPLCAAFFLRSKRSISKVGNLLMVILSSLVIVSTASRSSFVALMLGIVLFPVALKRTNPGLRGRRVLLAIILVISAGVITMVSLPDETLFSRAMARYETILSARSSASSLERMNLVDQSIDRIVRNPLIGVGLDNFAINTREGINVHNPILSMWVEGGLLGFIGFSLMYFIILLYCAKAWRQRFFGDYLFMGMAIMAILMIFGDMFMANSYKRVLWVPTLLFLTYYEVLSGKTENP